MARSSKQPSQGKAVPKKSRSGLQYDVMNYPKAPGQTLLYINSYPSKRSSRMVDEYFFGTRRIKMVKTEISKQKTRRLEKKKLKRQEKLTNEDDDAKRQRLNEKREYNSETPTQRQLKLDKTKLDTPSVRIDFGKDGVHLIQPKSKYNFTELRNEVLCWAWTIRKMVVLSTTP